LVWKIWKDISDFSSGVKLIVDRADEEAKKLGLNKLPLRPDIAILENVEECEKLVESFKVATLIECKNWEYNKWTKDIETQIIPYKRIFEPKTFILML